MKNILLLVLMLLSFGAVNAQTTIAEQDFDAGTTWSYSSDIPFFDNGWGNGFFGIIDFSSTGPLNYGSLSSNILGENDLNDIPDGTAGFATTTFVSTNISNFTSVVVSFDYDIDNYNANTDEAFYELFYDGVGEGEVVLQTGSTAGDDAEGSVSVNVTGGTGTVELRVKIRNNGNTGYSGFDNFKIEGTAVGSLIGFDNATSSQNETDATFNVSIPVTLSDYSSDVDLSVTVSGGTAEAGDYLLNTSSLSFTGNETKNVSIDINDDAGIDDETIELTIAETSATGVIISTSVHTLTIVDDECSITDVTVTSTSCNGDDAEFVITWTVLNGSGTYEVNIDGNGYQTLASGGTYTLTGVTTPATGVTVTVRDVNETTCMGTTTVDIPECPVVLPQIVITEVADPTNTMMRMVEVCNRGASAVNITGWKLNGDFNGNTTVDFTVNVVGSITLNAGECYVFANNDFPAGDLSACAGSVTTGTIDSNGNESFWLNDNIQDIDFYDGQTSNFADSKATRNSTVTTPTTTFSASEWTVTSSTGADLTPCVDAVLPVELRHFTAKAHNQTAIITWSTSLELNNEYFEIQHSTDNRTFTTIGKEAGAGNSDVKVDYSYTHANPANGINYYRLQQFDFDGQSEYSPVVSVRFGKETGISVYPNPVQAEVTITLEKEFATNATAEIISQNGRVVLAETFTAKSFTQTMNVNNLPTGIYVLRIVNGNEVYTERFVKK